MRCRVRLPHDGRPRALLDARSVVSCGDCRHIKRRAVRRWELWSRSVICNRHLRGALHLRERQLLSRWLRDRSRAALPPGLVLHRHGRRTRALSRGHVRPHDGARDARVRGPLFAGLLLRCGEHDLEQRAVPRGPVRGRVWLHQRRLSRRLRRGLFLSSGVDVRVERALPRRLFRRHRRTHVLLRGVPRGLLLPRRVRRAAALRAGRLRQRNRPVRFVVQWRLRSGVLLPVWQHVADGRPMQ